MLMVKSLVSGVRKKRLDSLDALRGFDMFWIIGARSIVAGLAGLNLPGFSIIANQLSHTAWNGFTFYDLIFPLFIFITGVSLILSMSKRLEQGDRKAILKHVIIRTVIMFLLGIVYNNAFINNPALTEIRIMGVLQRVALCYFFASLLVIYTKPRTQALTAAGIILGYWALMRFVPVPGYGPGILTQQGNLARYIDSLLLPGKLYFGSWDPEGLLSTVPAVATCLLGVLTGHWFRAITWRGRALEAKQRALYLFLGGLVLAIVGLLINPVFPINKNLWTSSYVLYSGGLSAMLLAAFHWVIDIRGHRGWAFPFVVVGMNSMFIYLVARFIPFDKIIHFIVAADLFSFIGQGQNLFAALVKLVLEGSLLLWLYKRKTFIKI
ncbi:MAG: acyltransferase family protein [Bacillota bacterium]